MRLAGGDGGGAWGGLAAEGMEDGGEGAAVQLVVADIQFLEMRGKVGH
jgi:hypothetical protein